MRHVQNKKLLHIPLALFMAVSSLTVLAYTRHADAATMSMVFVRFDRMKQNVFSSGTVCAKPTSTATEAKVKVTFPSGYTVSGTTGDWTVDTATNTASWPGGGTAVAWPSIGTATAASGQDVTFPSGDLTPGTIYCFNWTNDTAALRIKNSVTDNNLGSVTTQTSAPADIDTGQFTTSSLTNDQIVVTATVPTAFSFVLSGYTDDLGNLNTSTASTGGTPRTATINTNAKNGWMIWANSLYAGLHSATASYTISTNCSAGAGASHTLTTGDEMYNTGVTKTQAGGSGTITLNSAFDNTSLTTGKGGGLCTNYQTLASSTGSADNAVLTLTNNAIVKGSTPAATDYTDTITVVGAGLF